MLTDKQERFCREYIVDLNATQAAIRAGYSEKTANEQGAKQLAKGSVKDRISELQNDRSERTKVTADWIVRKLVENIEKAMQERPVLDEQGEPIGEYKYEGSVANKALEILARHLGMLKDRLVIETNRLPDLSKLSDDELRRLRELRDRIRGGERAFQTLRGT